MEDVAAQGATGGAEELTALMAGILDSLQAHVFLCDAEMRIVAVNAYARAGLARLGPELLENFGLNVDQMIGAPMHRFLGDPDRVAAILSDPALLPHADEISFGGKTFRTRVDALRAPGGAITGYTVVCEDVTRQRSAERELRAALRQRAELLRELHERVRVTLRLVSGLAALDEAAAPAWAQRLRAVAHAHELIYASGDVTRVDLDAFVNELARGVAAEHPGTAARVKIETAARAEIRDLDRLIVFGLIIHELTSNSLRHGFPGGRSGRVRVTARVVDGSIEAVVSDDGVGLPKDAERRSGLGLKAACVLIEQRLGGSWRIESRGGGFACLFTFPADGKPAA